MKKLITTCIASLLLFVVLIYVTYLNAPFIIGKIISYKMQTTAQVQTISLNQQGLSITHLEIDNPPKAQKPTALKIDSINIHAPLHNALNNPMVIEELRLDSVYVNIQIYNKEDTEGNWHTLLENMQEHSYNLLPIDRSTTVQKLILTNIKIDLILADGTVRELSPIKRLEFDNISAENGISSEDISDVITKKVIHSIFIENGLENLLKAPFRVIKKVIPFL